MERPVGDILREWRAIQGLSQEGLAFNAGVSPRHISFVETGRSRPSRKMVLRLSETLALPLRERNALLLAAGYAPIYPETTLDAGSLAPVRRALELVLGSHEPFPAFVLDRGWNVLLANRSHRVMLAALLDEHMRLPDPVNVMRLVLDPALLKPRIVNWEVVAHVCGHRVERQLREPGMPAELAAKLKRLLEYPGVRDAMKDVTVTADASIVIPMEFQVGDARLSFFSTLAAIGTPRDVTLEEICIESLFPADDATDQAVRAMMSAGDAAGEGASG